MIWSTLLAVILTFQGAKAPSQAESSSPNSRGPTSPRSIESRWDTFLEAEDAYKKAD